MDVTEAVMARKSTRAFLDTPVDDLVIAELLTKAARAPSGGNLQPWRVYVIGSAAMPTFKEFLGDRRIESPGYQVYPANLWEPYRTNRFAVGEQMYAKLGIPRDDRAARLARLAENYDFFGAPAAFFCFIDKRMGPPQWSDLGMFLQTFMLLAQEAGLDTCPQEAWASWSRTVAQFVGAPEEEMLFCGMAIGHADGDAPVNALVSERMPLAEWTTFVEP
ncbi:MAG: nitroreductase [Acidimicrobiia bacterium]|nr:nitroreductase [Acidimicrobiia bacterium]